MKRLFLLAVIAFSLTGCMQAVKSNFPIPANKQKAYLKHALHVSKIQNWQAHGLVGVRLKNQAQSANFVWTQKAKHFNIELYGPLGLGATYLKGQPGDVTLDTHDKKHYQASNAQSLMDQVLGWSVPVEGLVYWSKGIPIPRIAEKHTVNRFGFLKTLDQDGWHIDYRRYQNAGAYGLPHQMILTRPGIRVAAVFNTWNFFEK